MDRHTWAAATIRRLNGGVAPVCYGSPEFFAYPGPAGHIVAARTAALLVAAEAWAMDGDDAPTRLAAEVTAARAIWELREEWWMGEVVWPRIAQRAREDALRGIARAEREAQ